MAMSSAGELNRAYRHASRRTADLQRNQVNASMTRTLRQQALRELIQNACSSRRLRASASVSGHGTAVIVRTPAFTNQGRFDRWPRTLPRLFT